MIRLSAPDWCFYKGDMEPAEYYAGLKELGYDGAEMVDPARWDAARDAGLEIVNLAAPGIERGLNKREHHADLTARIIELIGLAGENGIPHIIVYSGARFGLSDDEGVENCRRCLEELLPRAEAAGVTLVFEMLNTRDHPDHHASKSAYGFEVAKKISSPNLKVLYDIYHMERMGEDGAADVVANLPLIAHLHVAQSPGRDNPTNPGDIDYSGLVPAVMKAGYSGYWGMEFEPGPGIKAELEEAARMFNRLAADAAQDK
jgi:hydroxypyruvate isomerase